MDSFAASPLLQVYLARRAELTAYFRVRLRSQEAAQDLVQDIYLKIISQPDADIQNPAAYLYRLGTNLMLDRLKQEQRTGLRDAEWQRVQTHSVNGEDIADTPAADDAVAARQRLKSIIDVVETLPPAVREAFRLHKLEGLNHAETAEAMGVSRSSIEKYIMTSLKLILSKVRP